MEISKGKLESVLIIKYGEFEDLRGTLFKPFSKTFFESREENTMFKEVWFTQSSKNVIRGMHYQDGDNPCEKLVSVVKGGICEVLLDLRLDSTTYGMHEEFKLSSADRTAVYIPKGIAHGYKVTEKETMVLYMATEVHSANDDIGVRWDSFGYDWGIDNPVVSQRDKELDIFLKEDQ